MNNDLATLSVKDNIILYTLSLCTTVTIVVHNM